MLSLSDLPTQAFAPAPPAAPTPANDPIELIELELPEVEAEPLLPRDGALPVVRPEVGADALARTAAPPERERHWRDRLAGISSTA